MFISLHTRCTLSFIGIEYIFLCFFGDSLPAVIDQNSAILATCQSIAKYMFCSVLYILKMHVCFNTASVK